MTLFLLFLHDKALQLGHLNTLTMALQEFQLTFRLLITATLETLYKVLVKQMTDCITHFETLDEGLE